MTTGEKKLVALLSSSTLALLLACGFLGWLAWRGGSRLDGLNTQAALADPALRDEIVRRMTAASVGAWDSHNDPEVGRMLQPNLHKTIAAGVLTQTNALGLREKTFELPKPPGVLRIVLLGDSFVQGFGVEAEDRLGVFLERYLAEHATGWTGPIECLHIGIGGWNVVSECAWLRRMLTELAPDLVFHILITNDLDDNMGVRGFGGLSAFAPLTMRRTDALVAHIFPIQYSSPLNGNYLLLGLDHESRQRFSELAEAIGKLASLVRQSGARYVAISHWANHSGRLCHFLKRHLEPSEFAALPSRLVTQPDLIQGPANQHWSRAGHELVARLLFTLTRERALLPQLALTPWPEVEVPALAELTQAWNDATAPQPEQAWKAPYDSVSSLEPASFADLEWRHVYTGLDKEGQVSPFASFFLRKRSRHGVLRLRGRALDRAELAGARVRASIQGVALGEHELVPGQPFDVRFPVPKSIKPRGGVTVHLETSDYVYAGPYRQHCISFVLDQLALE
ncbi:MAG: hypothetical protein HOP15_17720 [Planctomycetes bacterium]|nr:hypothetical protein [Planctomycetota bacterium]